MEAGRSGDMGSRDGGDVAMEVGRSRDVVMEVGSRDVVMEVGRSRDVVMEVGSRDVVMEVGRSRDVVMEVGSRDVVMEVERSTDVAMEVGRSRDVVMEVINKSILSPIKRRMRKRFLQRRSPSPPPPPPPPQSLPSDPDPEAAAAIGVGVAPPHNAAYQNLDWLIGFCFSSAVAIDVQLLQLRVPLPIDFHLMCLAMVCAVSALIVARYISYKLPNQARFLEHVSVFFGVTAFFLAITMSFPLCLKFTSWIIYALSLLAIIICNFS